MQSQALHYGWKYSVGWAAVVCVPLLLLVVFLLVSGVWILAGLLLMPLGETMVAYLARRSLCYAELTSTGLRVRAGFAREITISYSEIISAEERQAGFLSQERVRLRLRRRPWKWSWNMILLPSVMPLMGRNPNLPLADTSGFVRELRERMRYFDSSATPA